MRWLSPDGTEAYGKGHASGRLSEIVRASRSSAESFWATPSEVPSPINSRLDDESATLTADGLRMVFVSERADEENYDLWEASRPAHGEAWQVYHLGAAINTPYQETWPYITRDGLGLFFGSDRPGGYGNFDIYRSTRKSLKSEWSRPVNLGPTVNTAAYENWPVYWEDGGEFYFLHTDPELKTARIFSTQSVSRPSSYLMTLAGAIALFAACVAACKKPLT